MQVAVQMWGQLSLGYRSDNNAPVLDTFSVPSKDIPFSLSLSLSLSLFLSVCVCVCVRACVCESVCLPCVTGYAN